MGSRQHDAPELAKQVDNDFAAPVAVNNLEFPVIASCLHVLPKLDDRFGQGRVGQTAAILTKSLPPNRSGLCGERDRRSVSQEFKNPRCRSNL
jgi:hypothetical protein